MKTIDRLEQFFGLSQAMSLKGHTFTPNERQRNNLSDLEGDLNVWLQRAKARIYVLVKRLTAQGQDTVAAQAAVGVLIPLLEEIAPLPRVNGVAEQWRTTQQGEIAWQTIVCLIEAGFLLEPSNNLLALNPEVEYPEIAPQEYLGGALPDDSPVTEDCLWLGKTAKHCVDPQWGALRPVIDKLNAIPLWLSRKPLPEFEEAWEKEMWEGHFKACPQIAYLRWRVDGRGRIYPINTLSVQGADWLRSQFRLVKAEKCV